MTTDLHTHPCAHCGTPTECDGDRLDNPKGAPPVICVVYHAATGGRAPAFLCDSCAGENVAREVARQHG